MKVNKVLTLGVVGLSMVVFSGCSKKGASTSANDPDKVANMMDAGKSMYCVMDTSEGGTIETWTKGEKTKTYGTNMGGGKGMGYVLTDEEWTYMWVEGSTKGSKYPVTDEETPRSEGEGSESEMANFDMKQELAEHQVDDFKYDCKEQNIPNSTFVPPTNVEFKDVIREMETNLQNMESGLESFKQ